MEFDMEFDNKTLAEIISCGIQHSIDRDRLHALYREALQNQQATREHLRQEATRILGTLRKDGSFSKNPMIQLEYEGSKWDSVNKTTLQESGYWASYQHRRVYMGYSKACGIVGAYLLTQGLSDQKAYQGANI